MATALLPLLESYRLDTPLPAAYLLPSFVNEDEERYLLGKLEQLGVRESCEYRAQAELRTGRGSRFVR